MAKPKRTPEEQIALLWEITNIPFVKDILSKNEEKKHRDLTPRALAQHQLFLLNGMQITLTYIALIHLRWGVPGIRKAIDEMRSHWPMIDVAYTDLGGERDPYHVRLDLQFFLRHLLGLGVDEPFQRSWIEATTSDVFMKRLHVDDAVLYEAMVGRKSAEMPSHKRPSKIIEKGTKNHYECLNAVVSGDEDAAHICMVEGCKLYKQRARVGDSIPGEGLGLDNYWVFDVRLAAIHETARRMHGWWLPCDEVHQTALENAQVARDELAT